MSLIGFRPAGREERERGNRFFSERKYEESIRCYTTAISKSSPDHTSYTNRALCHLKLEEWSQAINDCQQAIAVQPTSIKAHFYMGQAQLQLEDYQGSVESLQRAHSLAKEQKRNFGDDIAAALRLAKRKKWQQTEKSNIEQESSLHVLLKQLLTEHKERQLSASVDLVAAGTGEDVTSQHEKRMEELDRVFKLADKERQDCDIPDYLCGKISFELMKDPCITPSGITYERGDIEEHLNRVGHFDPVTRKPLTVEQLVPNLAMKEVVDAFVADNEWAENF